MHIKEEHTNTSETGAPYKDLFAPADKYSPTTTAADAANVVATGEPSTVNGDFSYHYPAGFVQSVDWLIERAGSDGQNGALLFVSIENLAMIVNAYGQETSEQVMGDIAEHISKLLYDEDRIFRIQRDLFGVILGNIEKHDISDVATKVNGIIQNYGANSPVGALHVLCSIGSVDVDADVENSQQVIDRAFIACSATRGAIHRSFEQTREDSMVSRQQMGLANYLRKAIQENRLRLAFQPIIATESGNISHYEALLRLIGEDGKISSAGALIPIAERMGLIDMIDHMVLDMVVKELKTSPSVSLAFNVSNLTTDNPQWLEHITQLLKAHPEIAPRLIVEITETAAQRDLRRTAFFVASLQELGCQVALDDFGSGYTSFRQLKALSVDMVKIDGAFIKDLTDNADNRFFVKTLLDFTNGFGLKAVAEFVENGETAKMLMELGVDYMQGYYFAKPENFRSWLNDGEYTKS